MLKPATFLLVLLGPFFLLSVVTCRCHIKGNVCNVVPGVTGICVPLDHEGQSQDCHNIYGFLQSEVCEQQYGPDFANVSPLAYMIR